MSTPAGPPDMAAVISAVVHLNAGKYFQISAFVMLIYDHMLTFSDEVERIWKQRFSGATILFLLNRYLTPLQFIIIVDAFHDPRWTKKAGFGMSLQFVLLNATLTISEAVPLPPFLVGNYQDFRWCCILTGDSILLPAVWVTPLITDSCIFVLTVWRTRQYLTHSGKTPIMHIFLRDGAMYFFIIFLANLMNTVFYFTAPDDLKAIGASFSQLITATMISRLVLNLRSVSDIKESSYHTTLAPLRGVRTPEDTFVGRTLGSLGAELVDPGTESQHEKYDGEELSTRRRFR
ncbi:hypothetical protein BJ165DRAFT_1549707 [Panaeolus papilionaceus]|nr:hypothetical protein BJ165DRAFT_1549707 [Panaeolus papilionaceus]